jgi:adhesin transport system membrane fusion protein
MTDEKQKEPKPLSEAAPAKKAMQPQPPRVEQSKDFLMDYEEVPLAQHLQLFAIVAFFVIFLLWANFATLDEVTKGEGRVIPSKEIQILQNLEGGIIEAIQTWEGEEVKAGQVLMQLRDINAASEFQSNESRVFSLRASISRLQAEANGESSISFSEDILREVPESVDEERRTFRANLTRLRDQRSILDSQLRQRRSEVDEINTRIRGMQDQINLARQEKAQIEPAVAKGSLPQLELLKIDQRLSEMQSESNSLESSLPRANAAINEVQRRLEDAVSTARADAQAQLTETFAQVKALDKTLSALVDRKERTEIRSPVDGIIKDIKITTVGGVVQPGQDLIEIVPLDDKLLVEARVRPQDIAFLYPGQAAVVKITAYDFSIYGGLKGELVDISADTIEDKEGNSFYRVRVRTNETNLKRKGEILPIIPGMVASVDILTGKKTVMDYLIKPFAKTLENSLNER